MLSAGLLGGPGIGYLQDRHASNDLQANAPGFLYLIIHFRRKGGYKQIELTSQEET